MSDTKKYAEQVAAELQKRLRNASVENLYKMQTVAHHSMKPTAVAKIEAELIRRGLSLIQEA